MSARVHINVERQARLPRGFGPHIAESHRVTVDVAFNLGDGAAALSALDTAVAEVKANLAKAER